MTEILICVVIAVPLVLLTLKYLLEAIEYGYFESWMGFIANAILALIAISGLVYQCLVYWSER